MSGRRIQASAGIGLLAIGLALQSSPAWAQAPRPAGRHLVFGVGGSFALPIALDDRNADLLAPDGTALTVTRTADNRLGPGFGVEAHLGMRLGASLTIEGTGSWTRLRNSMRVSFDIEDADLITASLTSSQFAGEGAVLLTVHRRGRTEIFVRGSAGWMADVGGGVLIGDGLIVHAGGGLRRWFAEPVAAPRRVHLGVRIEGRLQIRQAGLSENARSLHVAPVFAGSLMMGF